MPLNAPNILCYEAYAYYRTRQHLQLDFADNVTTDSWAWRKARRAANLHIVGS